MTFRCAGIAGLGLIGGSVAAALRAHGVRVLGYDPDARHVRAGLDRGLIDEPCPTPGEAAREADVVVLAAPVQGIIQLLPEVDRVSPPDCLIIDTGSVKVPITCAAQHLAGCGRVVGGHPLSGKEAAGPHAADADLFRGHAFVLTPGAHTSEAAVRRARAFVNLLGARAITMTPERHDEVLARTSHLPQLLATALALATDPDDLTLIGPGFRDMTRLAGSDATMWRDILFANEANVTSAVNHFLDRLHTLLAAIESRDSDTLVQTMDMGRRVASLAQAGGDA